jgi:hypothetical protein
MTDIQEQSINEESIFDGGEFVVTRRLGDNGESEFLSGGYKVKSFFLESGMSPLTTLNDGKQTGGKVSSPFENLAIPAGLFYINQRVPKNNIDKQEHYYKKHEMISDDIMDKLFGLVESNKKQHRKTRKNINKQDKRKSKRQKK